MRDMDYFVLGGRKGAVGCKKSSGIVFKKGIAAGGAPERLVEAFLDVDEK